MGSMLLGVPNSSYIVIGDNAGYGYKFENQLDKYDIRTKGGELYTYVLPQSTFQKFEIPMTFVTSTKRAQVNSWFITATDLRFIEDDGFPNSYYSVRIVGKKDSFTKFVEPYFRQYYEGKIVIETI